MYHYYSHCLIYHIISFSCNKKKKKRFLPKHNLSSGLSTGGRMKEERTESYATRKSLISEHLNLLWE